MIEANPFAATRGIARALLYEGYALFPYGVSSLKNRRRLSFGELSPGGRVASAVPVELRPGAVLDARIGLLQPIRRTVYDQRGDEVVELDIGERRLVSFTEAREIEIDLGPFDALTLASEPQKIAFEAASFASIETLTDDRGAQVATVKRFGKRLSGEVRIALGPVTKVGARDIAILSVELIHSTESVEEHDDLSAMHSPHLTIRIVEGAFVSVIDPPDELRPCVDRCEYEGWWPILVGTPGSRDLTLLSPIILYDYPEVAPESPGDLFDATENDELLTLSILALTDDERRSMKAMDPRTAAILARCDALGERLGLLHGATRAFEVGVGIGDTVRLRTQGRDSFDGAIDGQIGRVVDIQVEVNGKEHLIVVLNDDPGRDMGLDEAGMGHRFFLSRSEVERVARTASERSS